MNCRNEFSHLSEHEVMKLSVCAHGTNEQALQDDCMCCRYQNIARIHGDGLKHLRSLKDILDVNLVPQNLAEKGSSASATQSLQPGSIVNIYQMQCPVLCRLFDKERIMLIPPCGHVVSHR
jgi:hypothetical protein